LRYSNNYYNRDSNKFTFGRFIRDEKVICIDQDDNNLGLVETSYALNLARQANLELVMVSQGNPSTCKILDFSKFKYESNKREKIAKKNQRKNEIKIKEVKFRPATNENDLLNKANQLKDFLSEGNKLKVTVVFKGRELCHRELGIETMKKFAGMICANFDGEPSMTGRNMVAILVKSNSKIEAAK
jgi:translation initiation factor IF-3